MIDNIKYFLSHITNIVRIVYLKTFPQALDNTSLIKVKPLEMYLACQLVNEMEVSFCDKIEIIIFTQLINHLSTVSIDS